jgi:hypothetical protein
VNLTHSNADPFDWDENDEDEIRVRCACGYVGPWRDQVRDARSDEADHHCPAADSWTGRAV